MPMKLFSLVLCLALFTSVLLQAKPTYLRQLQDGESELSDCENSEYNAWADIIGATFGATLLAVSFIRVCCNDIEIAKKWLPPIAGGVGFYLLGSKLKNLL